VHPNATLTVTLALPGDFNNDGTVDAADYVVWRKNLDTQNVLPNDISPGMVTQHDYALWRANFGKSRPAAGRSAANSHVPEPVPTALVVCGVIGLAAMRRCAWRLTFRVNSDS
jgi:hypothetical protein